MSGNAKERKRLRRAEDRAALEELAKIAGLEVTVARLTAEKSELGSRLLETHARLEVALLKIVELEPCREKVDELEGRLANALQQIPELQRMLRDTERELAELQAADRDPAKLRRRLKEKADQLEEANRKIQELTGGRAWREPHDVPPKARS